MIVGVVGGSASGKTTLAEALAGALGASALHIQHDDYYKAIPPGTDLATVDFDHPDALDNAALADHLAALRRGEPILRPTYDFETQAPSGSPVPLSPRPIVLIEGLFPLADPGVRDQIDLSFYVHADDEIRFRRRLERDQIARGWTPEEIHARFWGTVQRGHSRWIAPTRADADVVMVNHFDNAEDFLAAHLAPTLAQIRARVAAS